MLAFEPVHPLFAARVRGVDVGAGVSAADAERLRAALDEFSVLVFPGQTVTDPTQIVFTELFGPLETTRAGTLGAGSPLIVLTNFGPDGTIVPPSDRQVLNNRANQDWHHDSSFKPVSARASLLSAREIPSAGGNTEFANTCLAFAALPEAERAALRGKVAIHDLSWSRQRVDPRLVTETETMLPPVRQAVVLEDNPHGPALYLGAHARQIDGMDEASSRALIDRLIAFATAPRFVYSHRWLPGDMVLWDNYALMHRATPFPADTERRLMVRTTVAGLRPTTVQASRPAAA